MNIAIINYTGGGISGGYKLYLEQILPRLCESPRVSSILFAAPATIGYRQWLKPHPKVAFVDSSPFRPLRYAPSPELRASLDAFRPDVIFVPVERRFNYPGVPTVTMIQNMAPLTPAGEYPFVETLRMAVQRFEARQAVLKADRVVAMSLNVRDFLTGEWGLSPEKAPLIYFGIPPHGPAGIKPAEIPSDWEGSFFFTAGSLEPYRGLEDLIEAASLLKRKGEQVRVVIAGSGRPMVAGYELRVKKMVSEFGLQDNIIWLGNVGRAYMNWCYSKCRAFVITSRVEALAVVILEALSHGCACIAADSPPFPEAFGDAALFYAPFDPASLADKMGFFMRDLAGSKEEFRLKDDKAMERFSWEEAANKLLDVFLELTGRN